MNYGSGLGYWARHLVGSLGSTGLRRRGRSSKVDWGRTRRRRQRGYRCRQEVVAVAAACVVLGAAERAAAARVPARAVAARGAVARAVDVVEVEWVVVEGVAARMVVTAAAAPV